MSMRAPPTMKYDSISAFRGATSRGREASSNKQTKSAASFSCLFRGWPKNEIQQQQKQQQQQVYSVREQG